MKKRAGVGFTLIELLVVVAILGILTAIAIPSLLSAIDRSRQKSSMSDIRNLGTALESYSVDVAYYPISASMASIESLNPISMGIQPTYIKRAATRDGWNGLYLYGSTPAGSEYTVVSYGKDRKASSSSAGVTSDFDCDIIFQDGVFTAYPEGVQT